MLRTLEVQLGLERIHFFVWGQRGVVWRVLGCIFEQFAKRLQDFAQFIANGLTFLVKVRAGVFKISAEFLGLLENPLLTGQRVSTGTQGIYCCLHLFFMLTVPFDLLGHVAQECLHLGLELDVQDVGF